MINNILICGKTSGYGALEYTSTSLAGLTFTNNIVYIQGGSTFNLFYDGGSGYYDLPTWQSLTGKGANCINVMPSFVSSSGNDYHLQSFSKGVDNGTTLLEVTDDFEGNLRPAGTTYDIGCYEYGSAPLPPSSGGENPLDIVKVYPNPFILNGSSNLKIINLPFGSSSNIRIYNACNKLVKELSTTGISTFWDGKNLGGDFVSRGVYYCFISDSNGNKKIIRFGAVK